MVSKNMLSRDPLSVPQRLQGTQDALDEYEDAVSWWSGEVLHRRGLSAAEVAKVAVEAGVLAPTRLGFATRKLAPWRALLAAHALGLLRLGEELRDMPKLKQP